MYKHLKPIDKVCGYDVRPGIFMLNGARPVNGGVNFTINSIYATSCTLLLFKPNAKYLSMVLMTRKKVSFLIKKNIF